MATVINEPELIRKSKAEFDKYMAIEADEVDSAGVILDTDNDSLFSSNPAPHFDTSATMIVTRTKMMNQIDLKTYPNSSIRPKEGRWIEM